MGIDASAGGVEGGEPWIAIDLPHPGLEAPAPPQVFALCRRIANEHECFADGHYYYRNEFGHPQRMQRLTLVARPSGRVGCRSLVRASRDAWIVPHAARELVIGVEDAEIHFGDPITLSGPIPLMLETVDQVLRAYRLIREYHAWSAWIWFRNSPLRKVAVVLRGKRQFRQRDAFQVGSGVEFLELYQDGDRLFPLDLEDADHVAQRVAWTLLERAVCRARRVNGFVEQRDGHYTIQYPAIVQGGDPWRKGAA